MPASSRMLCACSLLCWALIAFPCPTSANNFRVYSHLLVPEEHPDYGRRAVRPPSWNTFKHQTQFTCLRGFSVQDDTIIRYKEELDQFTRVHRLGSVIWPSYPILFATNLADLAAEIKARDLYLFDVWGYVPGSGPGGYWQQFKPPHSAFQTLESILGERWLGTDIGEQDGRYVGGYANQMTPASASHTEQYLQFQRHFERMGDDLGHRHATLVSLNFGHYLIKEGTYTLIGAETAQALPNSQVYYAFIRGAGKQYGVPWFGNASIYNRWGYKTYGGAGKSDGYEYGPTKGTSLSLMKRLLYSHILYNSVAAGFENGWLDGEKLSPIGKIQAAAQQWVNEHPQPGVQYTPVAIMVDFFSGWSFPRHLYTDNFYRVWGNLPYNQGDYFTHAVLDLIYPGYEQASYFHDETGFTSPTPYGDIADCLLSDAPSWLLERYPVIVVTGELQPSRETADKLMAFARKGGHLVLAKRNARELPGLLENAAAGPGTIPVDQGRITILPSEHGVELSDAPSVKPGAYIDQPLPKPYVLADTTREQLHRILQDQALFLADPSLAVISCRKSPGRYTLGITNPTWKELPLEIVSRCGPMRRLNELPLDRSEVNSVGYFPESVTGDAIGQNTSTTIAGGDIRIFEVEVEEQGVADIPHRPPGAAPKGRYLPLRGIFSLQQALLCRPTFFQHYDGVVLDWAYLRDRERSALSAESRWLRRQGVRIAVDASSGINLYPDLRLLNNLAADYEASMASLKDLLAKMEIIGADDLLISMHRYPENNVTPEESRAGFVQTLRKLSASATDHKITLHLRQTFGKPPWSLAEALQLADEVGASSFKIAPSTALYRDRLGDEMVQKLSGRIGFWLVSASRNDIAGKLWNAHAHFRDAAEAAAVAQPLGPWFQVPVIFDMVLPTPDTEYVQSRLWNEASANPGSSR